VCPQVQIIVPKLGTQANVAAPTLPYVPSHLYHMLFETIKVYDWPPPPHARTRSVCHCVLTLFL
jgi:hypothetical protein